MTTADQLELAPETRERLGADHLAYILAQPDPLAELERRIDGAWQANLLDLIKAYDEARGALLEREA
jgi:hypothetical protein